MSNSISSSTHIRTDPRALVAVVAVAVASIGLAWVLEGRAGFSLWDEGFLWYGVQRTAAGEVPIRDFMAYDPGRYYFSAWWMQAFGDTGILNLRAGIAVFQGLGLFAALVLLMRRAQTGLLLLIVSAVILLLWMVPRHKLFDISLSLMLISVMSWLVESPHRRRYFVTGLCIGLIAVFGRNHGVYGVAGFFIVSLWLAIGPGNLDRPDNISAGQTNGLLGGHRQTIANRAISLAMNWLWWTAGVVIGYLPVLLMLLLVPGFGEAFWASIRFLFEEKATNLPLPVPWPWLTDFSQPGLVIGQKLLTGFWFVSLPLFGLLGLTYSFVQRLRGWPVNAVVIASSAMALPYAHFAYSRADLSHLAQGVFPTLIGVIALACLARPSVRWVVMISLLLTSLLLLHDRHPGWSCLKAATCEPVNISGDNVNLRKSQASEVKRIEALAEKFAPNNQSILIVPFWPGAYSLLGRRSPNWEIYSLFSRPRAFEMAEIERIKLAKPALVMILDHKLDGRDALLYRNTHPLTYQYIVENFDLVETTAKEKLKLYLPATGSNSTSGER